MRIYYNINNNNILDALPLSKETEAKVGLQVEGQGTHSLDAVCIRFGVPVLNHHNALEDAEMCGNLMVKFREILVEEKSIKETIPMQKKKIIVKEDKNGEPPTDEVSQTPVEESVNSKSGCLGIIVIGIILSSLIVLFYSLWKS